MRVVGKVEQVIAAEKFEILFDDKRAPEDKPGQAALETWMLKNISLRGMGAMTTRRAQGALRIGALMGFRVENTDTWCAGIVRRLEGDGKKIGGGGAKFFAGPPRLFWQKNPGSPQADAWDWETRHEDATSHHYLKTILLPADKATADDESLLVEPRSYR